MVAVVKGGVGGGEVGERGTTLRGAPQRWQNLFSDNNVQRHKSRIAPPPRLCDSRQLVKPEVKIKLLLLLQPLSIQTPSTASLNGKSARAVFIARVIANLRCGSCLNTYFCALPAMSWTDFLPVRAL